MTRRNFLKTGASIASFLGMQKVFSGKAFAQIPKKGSVMIVAHIDDEVLWFLPWLRQVEKVIIASLPATSAHLNIVNKYAQDYDALWQWGCGITSTQDYKERWLDPLARQELITDWNYDRMLRDIIANPEVAEIYTHNPWGEYGHLHHRQISKVVRELAVECGKDVWCPNIVIDLVCSGDGCNYNFTAAPLSEFSQKRAYFRSDLYERFRQYYLDEPINQIFPIKYWTGGGPQDFPQGYQEYFLAVSGGVDHTQDNSKIQQLIDNVPVFGK